MWCRRDISQSVRSCHFPATQKQAALLSVYTGLRRADIINLEWKDINLRYKNKSSVCLTIRKTKTVISLPLSTSATRLLRTISRNSPRVFPGLTEFMLNKEVPLLMEKAKIEKHITFHCFRHSFAMALINKGTDIYTIAKLMGHKSVTSTQVYAKLSDEQLRKAILRLWYVTTLSMRVLWNEPQKLDKNFWGSYCKGIRH